MHENHFHTSMKSNNQSQQAINQNLVHLLPQLQQYCRYLSQNKWDGEDIAQEVIVKALDRYSQKDEITPALLKRMAYNFWIDTIRKRKNEATLPLTELEESKKESNGVLDVIDFLMKTLTPKQAVIVMLKEGFQFQLKEIAMLLDTTEVAVKASLHRARKRMDKREPEKASFSNELYWTNKEQEQLYELFHKAVELQDPTVLIKAIPSIRNLKKKTGAPIAVLNKNLSYPNSSPSSTLSLAA